MSAGQAGHARYKATPRPRWVPRPLEPLAIGEALPALGEAIPASELIEDLHCPIKAHKCIHNREIVPPLMPYCGPRIVLPKDSHLRTGADAQRVLQLLLTYDLAYLPTTWQQLACDAFFQRRRKVLEPLDRHAQLGHQLCSIEAVCGLVGNGFEHVHASDGVGEHCTLF